MKKNLKALIEKRNALIAEQQEILDKVQLEERAIDETEEDKFEQLKKEIAQLAKTIEMIEGAQANEPKKPVEEPKQESEEERDIKHFAMFVRGTATGNMQMRSEANLTKGDNGVVIPQTIANKILKRVEEISPVYEKATKYTSKGTLVIPVESTADGDIVVGFADEFVELESSTAKLTSITLKGNLYGALTKVSKSLLNNSDINLTNWVIDRMARNIAKFIENVCLNGADEVKGIAGSVDATHKVSLPAAITADALIDLQDTVPDEYQGGAMWVMSPKTRNAVRKLKDNDGQYLLNKDVTGKWSYQLLGKPVFVSDNVAELTENGKPAVFYGDFAGLAVKEAEKTEIQVLREKYATQHAIGVNAWGEIDAAVELLDALSVGLGSTAKAANSK